MNMKASADSTLPFGFLALITGLWLLSFYGIQSVPLEKHEVFVLETAQSMLEQHEWVVPRFNDQLRLQKPPLSYWAVMTLTLLDPFHGSVEIAHGRLVSLLAGLGILWMTSLAGARLFGRPVGMAAGIILLCMQGFLHISYNARPDALYGFFCLLQLYLWIGAWRAPDRSRRQFLYAIGGWTAFALAILTKGPQAPLMLLVGLLLFLVRNGELHRTLRLLRPATGLTLCALLLLPWSLALHHRLQAAGVHLTETQLSGSLLTRIASWKDLLSFYYPLRLLALTLPASLLVLFLIVRAAREKRKPDPAVRMLVFLVLTLILVFSLGGQYRKHYLFPALPLIALLTAQGLATAVRSAPGPRLRIAFGLVAGAGLLVYATVFIQRNPVHAFLLVPLAGGAAAVLALRLLRGTTHPSLKLWKGFGLALAFSTTGLYGVLPHRVDRRANQDLAHRLSHTLPPGSPVALWTSDAFTLPYYFHRPVLDLNEYDTPAEVLRALPAERPAYLVLPTSKLDELDRLTPCEPIDQSVIPEEPDENLSAVRLPEAP